MDIIQVQQIFSVLAALTYCTVWKPTARYRYRSALAWHFLSLAALMYSAPSLQLGGGLSIFMLLTLLICWQTVQSVAIRRLLVAAAAAAALAPVLLPSTLPAAFSFHAVSALIVYALAAAAFLLCLDLRVSENKLRRQPCSDTAGALLVHEARYYRYVLLSFLLLTLTLLSGILSAVNQQESVFALTHKQLFAYLTWGVFLVLLVGRHFFRWRGRAAQNWFFIGYVFLLLSYAGSTFVKHIILNE